MTLTLQLIQERFQANHENKLSDGALIAELSQADPTAVLRVLNQYTQTVQAAIEEKASDIAASKNLDSATLLLKSKQNFATSFGFIQDCQKAANILESVASLPEEADLYSFLTRYSQLRKDYDAIVELMIVDAL